MRDAIASFFGGVDLSILCMCSVRGVCGSHRGCLLGVRTALHQGAQGVFHHKQEQVSAQLAVRTPLPLCRCLRQSTGVCLLLLGVH